MHNVSGGIGSIPAGTAAPAPPGRCRGGGDREREAELERDDDLDVSDDEDDESLLDDLDVLSLRRVCISFCSNFLIFLAMDS